eukprot:COSAG02_NODE_701_length_18335_cov_18.672955_4_plen_181_part_00
MFSFHAACAPSPSFFSSAPIGATADWRHRPAPLAPPPSPTGATAQRRLAPPPSADWRHRGALWRLRPAPIGATGGPYPLWRRLWRFPLLTSGNRHKRINLASAARPFCCRPEIVGSGSGDVWAKTSPPAEDSRGYICRPKVGRGYIIANHSFQPGYMHLKTGYISIVARAGEPWRVCEVY